MKFTSILFSGLLLFCGVLHAQKPLKFVNIPPNLQSISIADPVFIGTDSSGNKGLIGKNGKWLGNHRFSNNLLGPVAGVFFGIDNPEQRGMRPNPLRLIQSWTSALSPKESLMQLFVYRLDTLGKILDSFRLSTSWAELADAGLKCYPNFPDQQMHLLPARGKPVPVTFKMPDNSDGIWNKGIRGEVSYFLQYISLLDSLRASAFPESIERMEKPEKSQKIYENFRSPGACNSIHGFSYQYISWHQDLDLTIIEKKKNGRFWSGHKVCFQPGISETEKPALWIRHKDGILCFSENQVSGPYPMIFRESIDTLYDQLPIIYTGQSGNYRAHSACLVKAGVLPEKTSFLFSYSGMATEESEKIKEAGSPELSLFSRVENAFIRELRENDRYDPYGNFTSSLMRPAVVLEKNGSLFAITKQGRAYALPAVKDTVAFLCRLRFQYIESKNQYIPIWSGFHEAREGLLSVLEAGGDAESQPELLAVPSNCLPAGYRSGEAISALYFYSGNLYSEKGLRLPISGKIVSVPGTWNQRLLVQVGTDEKTEIRDAENKLIFSGLFSNLTDIGSGWLQAYDGDGKPFLLIPGNGSLKKGKSFNSIQPLEGPSAQSDQVPYKGDFARQVPRLFATEAKETFFLTDYYTDELDGTVLYTQLVDGIGHMVMQGPLTREEQVSAILLKSKTASRRFEFPFGNAIDSVMAPGKKRAWLLQDASGFILRLKGKNQRLPARKVYIPEGGKIAYFEEDRTNGNTDSTWADSPKWKGIDENGKTTRYDFNPVSAEGMKQAENSYTKRLFRYKAGLLCRISHPDLKTLMFYPATGKATILPQHNNFKFASLLPDSLCPDKQQKWLVFPSLLTSNHFDFLQWVKNGVLTNEEALALIASGKEKLSPEEFNFLTNRVTPLDEHFRALGDRQLVPLTQISSEDLSGYYPTLMRSPAGLQIHFRDKDGNLLPDFVNPDDYFADPASSCYAIRRKNGLFELFDLSGSLGEFRKLRASVSIKSSENWIKILMAERGNGEIVGFYPEGRKMVMFRPEVFLQKAFPFLPSFRAGTYPEFKAPDTAMTILPEANERKIPFGYFSERNVLADERKLFNPFGLSEKVIAQSLQQEATIACLRFQEVRANGNFRTCSIKPPDGYRMITNQVAISKSGKDAYSVFIPIDSAGGPARKKNWLYEAGSRKIYSFNGTGSLEYLDDVYDYTSSSLNPYEIYMILNDKPVQLSSISEDISGFREADGQTAVVMNPWSGFIDKKGRQKISISCEGGSCSGEVVQFSSGFAAINKGDNLIYIDTTGKNPFGLRFSCASDFNGNYAIVFNPELIDNGLAMKNNPGLRNEAQPNAPAGNPPENPGNKETVDSAKAAVDTAAGPCVYTYFWLHKSGKLICMDSLRQGIWNVLLNHNGEFTAINGFHETIRTLDTSGKVRGILKDHILYAGESSMYEDSRLRIRPFISQGLFRVQARNDKIGYCNIDGKLVIPCRFQRASSFSNGIAAVTEAVDNDSERNFYIDLKGNQLFAGMEFTETFPFSEGIACAVLKDRGPVLLDSNGKILEHNPDNLFGSEIHFKNGMASFFGKSSDEDMQTMQGYLNRSGKTAIAPRFRQGASDFSEGIAFVSDKDGKSFFIDKSGKRIPELPEVGRCGRFSEGLCHVILPEILRGFDFRTGKIQALQPLAEPNGFEWMRSKEFLLEEKSRFFSVWKRYNENYQPEYKILRH